jgi:hypothetical protein
MSDERLERIEKRLDEIAEMLRELVEMARRDWEIYQAALNSGPGMEQTAKAKNHFRDAMKRAAEGSAAYSQGGNAYTEYLKKRYGDVDSKLHVLTEGAPDVSDVWTPGEDALAPFYETEDSEKREVKKGEIEVGGVPQKVIREAKKARKGTPD